MSDFNESHQSGAERVSPLVYLPDGDRYVVFASKAGAHTNPDWYHNIKANPETTIEVGDESVRVSAEEVTGNERDALYRKQASIFSGFADYEQKTSRVIPVLVLSATQ